VAMTAIDLFSGCGGLTLGLKMAGFSVKAAIEIDKLAVETYRANHPEVVVLNSDIRTVDANDFMLRLQIVPGAIDLVAGCPPCQGFSSIRTLNGNRRVDDQRNNLLFDYLRFVRELKPKSIMFENVPGLINEPIFSLFMKELRTMGFFCTEAKILDAKDYGVPQRRKRLIVIAARNCKIHFSQKLNSTKTVRDAIGNLPPPGSSGDSLHDMPENRSERIKELIATIPKDGGSRKDLEEQKQLACHTKCNGFKDVYGRMAWDNVSPTITGGCVNPSKGRFLHPDQDRAISLREAALLQSFPPNYTFIPSHGKGRIAQMIGNALPPILICSQALEIRQSLEWLAGLRKKGEVKN